MTPVRQARDIACGYMGPFDGLTGPHLTLLLTVSTLLLTLVSRHLVLASHEVAEGHSLLPNTFLSYHKGLLSCSLLPPATQTPWMPHGQKPAQE